MILYAIIYDYLLFSIILWCIIIAINAIIYIITIILFVICCSNHVLFLSVVPDEDLMDPSKDLIKEPSCYFWASIFPLYQQTEATLICLEPLRMMRYGSFIITAFNNISLKLIELCNKKMTIILIIEIIVINFCKLNAPFCFCTICFIHWSSEEMICDHFYYWYYSFYWYYWVCIIISSL